MIGQRATRACNSDANGDLEKTAVLRVSARAKLKCALRMLCGETVILLISFFRLNIKCRSLNIVALCSTVQRTVFALYTHSIFKKIFKPIYDLHVLKVDKENAFKEMRQNIRPRLLFIEENDLIFNIWK